MKTLQNILHSSQLKSYANRLNLTSIATALAIVTVPILGLAQETPDINPQILEFVDHVKNNPTWVSGDSMYVKINDTNGDPYIRVIYRDFSPSNRQPDSIVGIEDTISVIYDNYSECCINLDMSNLPGNKREEFLETVRKINNYFSR